MKNIKCRIDFCHMKNITLYNERTDGEYAKVPRHLRMTCTKIIFSSMYIIDHINKKSAGLFNL